MAKAPKSPSVPSKYTHETIQISLVRSFTTSESTSAGKTSATSSGRVPTYTESKESVKDSTTSFSSSENEPLSSTVSEDSSSEDSVYGEDSEAYPSPLPPPNPSDPSREINCISYRTSRQTTDTGSASTCQSEMPNHRSLKFRRLSSMNNKTLSSRKNKRSSGETSTYITSNTTGSLSFNSSSISKSLSNSNQEKSTSTFHPRDVRTTLETITEDEYIRAHLMLPTNKVISILMKKDENLGEFLADTDQEIEASRYRGPRVDRKRQQLLIIRRSAHRREDRKLREEDDKRNRSRELKCGLQEHSTLMTKDNSSNDQIHKDTMEDSREASDQRRKLSNDIEISTNQFEEKNKLGTDDLIVLTKDDDLNCPFSLDISQTVSRFHSQPLNFNLPTLPKLNHKSVSFKINTEIIRPRDSKAKSSQSFRRHRAYTLRQAPDKETNKYSSLRCAKFVPFNQLEKAVTKETEASMTAEKKDMSSSKYPKKDSDQPLKYKMVDKANSPIEVPPAFMDIPNRNKHILDGTMNQVSLVTPSVSNKVGNSLRESIERQIQRRLQNKLQKNEAQNRCTEEPIHRYDQTPSGRTKNYVRFFESTRLAEPDSMKYNFQDIRKKFESTNSRSKSEKPPCNAGVDFNISNIHKNFSVNSKLIKHICHDKPMKKQEFRANNEVDHEENRNGTRRRIIGPNNTFNNLLEEIINTVERTKSTRSVRSRPKSRKIDQESKRKDQDKSNPNMCTILKLNDNDTEFKQLQHIFKTVKRNCKKKILREVNISLNFKETLDGPMEDHLKNFGQHLCRLYLKCFRKEDQMCYSQNDFVNIRKVVNFFLNYLALEHNYTRANASLPMANLLYSVFERISQHHFRLKHHLRTLSEKDPENDPWPVTVYDQLTKFNMMVNSKSHKNYSASTTKLKQSSSTHSEHSIKYFAIDYFLKLLKIIFIETKEGEVLAKQPEDISGRATTASSFNSHHYCALQSRDKSSLNSREPDPSESARWETPIAGGEYDNAYSTETDEESAVNTSREQWKRVKHKRFKKRKNLRFFVEKQTSKEASYNKIVLSKFDINKAIISKTFKGKSNPTSKSTFKPTNQSLNRNSVETSYNNAIITKINDNEAGEKRKEKIPIKDEHKLEDLKGHSTPSPVRVIENANNDDSELIKEVSNLVGTIVSQQSKNVNIEKIKEQINAVLTRNMVQMNALNKQTGMDTQSIQLEKDAFTKDQEKHIKIPSVNWNQKISNQIENVKSQRRNYQSRRFSTNHSIVIEHLKQDIHELKIQQEIQSKQFRPTSNYTSQSVQEHSPKVIEELLRRGSAMIPVNMIKNPHKEQLGLKNIVDIQHKNGMNYKGERDKMHNNVGKSCVGTEKDRSVSCENRRNKLISNKINQKIMELTKNIAVELPRPVTLYDDKPSEKKVEPSKPSTETSMKPNNNQNIGRNKITLPVKIESNEKEVLEIDSNNTDGPNETLRTTKTNQKTTIISNDDLFFPNRRKLSIFKRPFHSILGFESDLLSDVKGSDDDDFSIHELFKKTYHRHESNSFTDHLNHENVIRIENPERKRHPTVLESKDKYLTKKQLEVFDKLRTMFQEEQRTELEANQTRLEESPCEYARKMRDNFCDLDSYMNQIAADINSSHRNSRGLKAARGSRSQSYIYEGGSNVSSKSSKSSETIQDMIF